MRVILFLTLGLVGCAKAGTDADPSAIRTEPKEQRLRPGIELAENLDAFDNGAIASRFDFAQVRVLWVRIRLPTISRIQAITVTLRSPSGSIFHQATVPFSDEATLDTVRHPKSVRGGFALDYPIGIWGSSITRYPEPGQWQIEVDVDGTGRTLSSKLDVVFVRPG